ncbi:hypothetical protein D3C75_760920 [compost metagenome]
MLLAVGNALRDVLLVFVQRIELADILGELIVQSRQILAFDVMQLDLEYNRLALQLFGLIVLREGYVDILLFVLSQSNQLLFEAGDKAAGTDLQGVLLGFAAVERYAVQETLEVDDNSIAVLYCALFHNYQLSVALLKLLQFVLDIFFGYFGRLGRNFDALVLAQLNFRLNGYFSSELQLLALAHLLNVDLRTVNRNNAGFGNSFHVRFREKNVESILIQALYAEALLEHAARHFAFTEARNRNLGHHFLKCFIQSCVNAVGRNFDSKNPQVLLYFFPIRCHDMLFPSNKIPSWQISLTI